MKRHSIDCSYHIQKSYDNLLNGIDKIHKTTSYPSISSVYGEKDSSSSNNSRTICHIGVGNFFKSHQLTYINDLNCDRNNDSWNVIGIGVLENDQIAQRKMRKNNYNYNVISIDSDGKSTVNHITSLNDIKNSFEDLYECISTLSCKKVKILSLTITELGYSIPLNDDDINLMKHCLISNSEKCKFEMFNNITAFGLILSSQIMRFVNNIEPFTVLSCDNLLSNGELTRNKCMVELQRIDLPEMDNFINWFRDTSKFPNTMVDRITPQLSVDEICEVSKKNMLIDELPVVCEEYKCWIVQDDFVNNERPNWENVDVKFVEKVEPYEILKVSILNITHLYISYLGLNNNLSFVHEVMYNEEFYILIKDFIFEDIIPVIDEDLRKFDIDCREFAELVLVRFKNKHMKDKLSRICCDGIEKFKQHSKTLLLKGLNANLKMHNFVKFINEFIIYEKIKLKHSIFRNIPFEYIDNCSKLGV